MEHNADETMPIKVIGTIMGGVVKELETGLEFHTVFFHHGIINGKEYGRTFQGRWHTA